MKKSLRQLMLVGLSATMLAGIVAPAVLAQDDATEDTIEQMEETEEMEMTDEETVAEDADTEETTEATEVDAEASEVQQGVDEALAIYEAEYPESVIEAIEVDLDLDEVVYTIMVRGFDVDNNDYELDLEWADGEVKEQQFNEGWFNFGDGETESVGGPVTNDEVEEIDVEETVEDAELVEDIDTTEETEMVEDADTTEDAPVEEQLDEEQARLVLDMENLLTIDEASDIALEEAGSGEIDHWHLSADTRAWWDLFGDEENENPVWVVNVVNMDEGTNDLMGAMNDLEVRIDAVTGEVLNQEDVDEQTDDTTEEAEMTEETTEMETEVEETVEETTVE